MTHVALECLRGYDKMTTENISNRIVVGVDGSSHAQDVLAVAIEEARLRGATLSILYAYAPMPSAVVSRIHDGLDQLQARAHDELEKILAQAPSMRGLQVESHTVPDEPAHALIEASNGAAMLVVGTRGDGGFSGLLLGSVSSKCVHHAHCSVLVVRR